MSKPTHNPEQDRRTLELLVQGDPEGLQALIIDHGPHVRAYLQRKLGQLLDHWQIEEAMSLAAQRAWLSAPRFDPSQGQLRAWYAVVARNCALSLIAQQQEIPFVPIDGMGPTILGIASGPSEAKRMQMIVDVHRGINMLPPLLRNVLLADLNAGTTLPAPVLAERLQTTIQSIYAARYRGQRELRKHLELLGYRDASAPDSDRATDQDAKIKPVDAPQFPPEELA